MIINKLKTFRKGSMILIYIDGIIAGIFPDSTPYLKAIETVKGAH